MVDEWNHDYRSVALAATSEPNPTPAPADQAQARRTMSIFCLVGFCRRVAATYRGGAQPGLDSSVAIANGVGAGGLFFIR